MIRANVFTPEEEKERKEAFDAWLREQGSRLGFYLLPPNKQDYMRKMLKWAFYAGHNFERRKHLILDIGGDL